MKSTKHLFSYFMRRPKNREDLISALRDAEDHKILDHESEGMLEGVLQVSVMQVKDIMVPKSKMIYIESHDSFEEILRKILENLHSRYPVIHENEEDKVVGILLAKNLLAIKKEERFDINRYLQPVILVPETQFVDKLLKRLKKERSHMAMVIDEYGHLAGLVTMEDILEQIVGDIEDESDKDEDDEIRPHGAEFIVKGSVSLENFDAHFNTDFANFPVETLGGLLSRELGHIPTRNETYTIKNIHFTVLHADKRKVILVRVKKISEL
jgi:magnesium and cobalt transporter